MKRIFIKWLLDKYKPRLVVVFGRYGKEEARIASAIVLAKHSTVFSSSLDNFFNNFYENIGGFFGVARAFITKSDFPNFCIIDTDPDSIIFGELRELLGIDLALITAVGDVPYSTNAFAGAQKRSEKIIREARKARHIVYVYDDETVHHLLEDATISKKSYGFSEKANIRIDNVNNWIYIKQKVSGGVSLKVDQEGSLIPFNLINCYGKRNIYAAASALGTALYYEINFVSATQDLSEYLAPMYSFALYNAIKSTAVISHTKDVTPLSAGELVELAGVMRERGEIKRLVIILGDVLLRVHEEAESLHRDLGKLVAHSADMLVLVGERVKFTAEEARKQGMDEDRVSIYATAEDATLKIVKKIRKGDTILVLGSKEMNMEKIVNKLKIR